jgi:hypothetical protein
VSVPIWLTLTSSALADRRSMPRCQPLGVGDEQVVADDLHLGSPSWSVRAFQPAQSSSSSGSSIETSG